MASHQSHLTAPLMELEAASAATEASAAQPAGSAMDPKGLPIRSNDSAAESEAPDAASFQIAALEPLAEALDELVRAVHFSCAGFYNLELIGRVCVCWWDEARDDLNKVNMIRFEDSSASSEELHRPLKSLVESCQPATFGHGSEDVLDETYGKAGKIDVDRLMTDFNPYKLGFIKIIQNTLVPDDVKVRAELCKLTVYSAGGFSKPHADTPRDENQFGWLEVCLPVSFTGGDLAIRHSFGEEIVKWAEESSSDIQWTAFYIDCEYEVLPVVSGHRVTLTYNLFAVDYDDRRQAPLILSPSAPMSAVEERLKAILADARILPTGGRLGIHPVMFYAHAAPDASEEKVFGSLQGSDLALQSMFCRYGLNFDIVSAAEWPVISEEEMEKMEGPQEPEPDRRVSTRRERGGVILGPIQPESNLSVDELSRDFKITIDKTFPGEIATDVYWLNKPYEDQLDKQLTYVARDNASLGHKYTSLAFVVDIPSFAVRDMIGLASLVGESRAPEDASEAAEAAAQ